MILEKNERTNERHHSRRAKIIFSDIYIYIYIFVIDSTACGIHFDSNLIHASRPNQFTTTRVLYDL